MKNMPIVDFYRTIPTKSADQVREIISGQHRDGYNLIDVRQPQEYERGHIPGAILIPLGEIPNRMSEIAPGRPAIVYCRSGNRSMSAAAMLINSNFNDVYNLDGGISAYNGLKAHGSPEVRSLFFPTDASFETIISLAWSLEEGLRIFYSSCKELSTKPEVIALFTKLTEAEDMHKTNIEKQYADITGKYDVEKIGKGTPHLMEALLNIEETIQWCQGKDAPDIIELSMTIEANSYDLYAYLQRKVEDEQHRTFFRKMADEELLHLRQMASVLGQLV
ncbi:rhodanese homology domain/ferritin-like domain-containing protein [Candidatus Magnetobacterium bavaricum]|uniref:Rhodanese homology domain/ferritin-like domain-containing protein n=1 Tax=Candidatus Magnetobacterium bavaricum TaxID=29290 RepID=A0A0F3GPW2_9BACT|nr:rhodanese homology domain/ferritin-like domain-containing protein [Candidatus Magnetobacterium bavaricum]